MKSLSFLFILCLLVSSFAFAAETEVIEFPDEELETETVLPIFPNREAVKGRLVSLSKKIELGGSMGSSLNEAFYEPIIFGGHAVYHLDEMQGFRFSYVILSTTVNSNAVKLKETLIVGPGNEFDASLAPAAKSIMTFDYEYSAFYGKISLTKQIVYNTSTYFIAGLGMIDYEGTSEMGLHLGLGQKVFFTPKIALKLDLSFLSYQGPDPTDENLDLSPGQPKQPVSAFAKRTYFNQMLMGGIVFLF